MPAADLPADPSSSEPPRQRVTLVTGLSGAGNSTAIRALEDLGHEAIDNLPLPLLSRLLSGEAEADSPLRPMALGIDARTRGFSAEAVAERLAAMRADPKITPRMVFLDCAGDTLLDRFKITRRRHPLAPAGPVEAGIALEREVLAPLREKADLVIDTTGLSPHDLKARLAEFESRALDGPAASLAILIQSFSFVRGAPREADTVFDCRFLRNPHWSAALRPLDGRDAPVREYVAGDPLYAPFLDRVVEMTKMLLPAYRREGKAYYCLAFGCSGGRHRSVAAAEALAAALTAAGWRATVRHRELAAGDPAR